MGELAKTQGDAFVSRSISQIPLFRVFPPLFPSSFQATSFTLGHNELRSLVAIGSQMCCGRCQCHGVPWRVTQTHAGSHAGATASERVAVLTTHHSAPPRFHLLFPRLSFAFILSLPPPCSQTRARRAFTRRARVSRIPAINSGT